MAGLAVHDVRGVVDRLAAREGEAGRAAVGHRRRVQDVAVDGKRVRGQARRGAGHEADRRVGHRGLHDWSRAVRIDALAVQEGHAVGGAKSRLATVVGAQDRGGTGVGGAVHRVGRQAQRVAD